MFTTGIVKEKIIWLIAIVLKKPSLFKYICIVINIAVAVTENGIKKSNGKGTDIPEKWNN